MKRCHEATRALARFAIALAVAAIPLAAAGAEDRFSLSEADWAAGAIPEGRIMEKRITVVNNGNTEVTLEISSDTPRLSAEPWTLRLGPKEPAAVALFFDTVGVTGEFSHRLIFKAGGGAGGEKTFAVTGQVDSPARLPVIDFFFYFDLKCHECQEFLNVTVPGLEKRHGVRLTALERDVLDPPQLDAFKRKVKQLLGERARDLPAVIIGTVVLQGKEEIKRDFERAVAEYAAGKRRGTSAASARAGGENIEDALSVVQVMAAGLLDGINPCVFSTLIFLLAYLAYAGRTKRQILLIGLFYSGTVFVSYFLIGLGFFRVLHAASAFPIVSFIIQIVLVGVLVVFAGMSVYDFIMIRQGRVKDILLQLPDRFKDRIRKTIRAQAASVAIVASTVVLAFLVSVFELACTGQIYFPTIASLVQTRRDISDFAYLALYNLAFIAPLAVVFFLTYRGLSSEKLTAAFQKHMALVKILTAAFFLALTVIVVIFNILPLAAALGP